MNKRIIATTIENSDPCDMSWDDEKHEKAVVYFVMRVVILCTYRGYSVMDLERQQSAAHSERCLLLQDCAQRGL